MIEKSPPAPTASVAAGNVPVTRPSLSFRRSHSANMSRKVPAASPQVANPLLGRSGRQMTGGRPKSSRSEGLLEDGMGNWLKLGKGTRTERRKRQLNGKRMRESGFGKGKLGIWLGNGKEGIANYGN